MFWLSQAQPAFGHGLSLNALSEKPAYLGRTWAGSGVPGDYALTLEQMVIQATDRAPKRASDVAGRRQGVLPAELATAAARSFGVSPRGQPPW